MVPRDVCQERDGHAEIERSSRRRNRRRRKMNRRKREACTRGGDQERKATA